MLGELGRIMQKNETGRLSHTIHKDNLRMDERPKLGTQNHKNPRTQHRWEFLGHQPQQHFPRPFLRQSKHEMNSQDYIKFENLTVKKIINELKGNLGM